MHEVFVGSRRKQRKTLEQAHPGAEILDLTSKGPEPWVRFSPFFPHGGIPVPLSPGVTAESVEGIWQALKVFESAGVDPTKLAITSMKGIKRTVRKHGRVLGHRRGLRGDGLLDYAAARRSIYLPAYRFVLENRLVEEVERLRTVARSHPVVLLDYETNASLEDLSRPLSHASLVARYVTTGRI